MSSHASRSNGRAHDKGAGQDVVAANLAAVADKAHAVVDSAAGFATHGVEQVGGGIARGAKLAHRAVDGTADQAVRLGNKGFKLGRDLTRSTTQYASKHPLKALGIALGAGFLLAKLFRD